MWAPMVRVSDDAICVTSFLVTAERMVSVLVANRSSSSLRRRTDCRSLPRTAATWHVNFQMERNANTSEPNNRADELTTGYLAAYAVIRTKEWHQRMEEAFEAIYFRNNFETKIHGLRMLDGRVLGNYPLASADSTNLACNVPKTEVKYPELTRQFRGLGCDENGVKAGRCAILKGAIENVIPPSRSQWLRRVDGSGSEMPSHPTSPLKLEARP